MKKVKAVDIARELGISKATVSLALNQKPGVSDETRKLIWACREKLENEGRTYLNGEGRMIKALFVRKSPAQIEWGRHVEFPNRVMATFEEEARRDHFTFGISYASLREDDIARFSAECMQEDTAGVILLGTELSPEDARFFEKIKKPLVVYDTDFENGRNHCVVANNRMGVKKAMNYLYENNIRGVVYLRSDLPEKIYNFEERRKAFAEYLIENNRNPAEEPCIVKIGGEGEEVCRNMKEYLKRNELPEAFITECYQLTIGVVRALREQKVRIPEDVSIISIDEVPAFYTDGLTVTAVRIPHEERARMAMRLLKLDIAEKTATKSNVLTNCELVKGESVRTDY